ncbi:hypothetical protein BD413DRAFT_617632 [Trametes elegans]|nr:hypothetical protein BD413DRAFT_617632 [Trametes elegans]
MALTQNTTAPPMGDPLSLIPKIPALDNSYGAMLLGTSFGLIYHFLITDYANAASLLTGHWSVKINVAVTGASDLICQAFYARRVFLLGQKSRWVVVLAVGFMVACLGFVVGGAIEAFRLSLADFPRFSWLVSAAYGCAMATDVLLTGALIRVLLHSRTGFKRTDNTLDMLIVYSINTGLLTTVTGLMVFVFALILPGNYIYAGISIVNSKLYANSVLAVLNSRRSLASSTRVVDDFELYPTNTSSSRSQRSHNTAVLDTWTGPQVSVSLHPTPLGGGVKKMPGAHDGAPGLRPTASLEVEVEEKAGVPRADLAV